MTRIVILGAGTAGTIMANRLRRMYARDVQAGNTTISVVDGAEVHLYQPGLLFVPFGEYEPADLARPQRSQLHRDVDLVHATIDRVEATENRVYLASGESLDYDALVVATGTRIAPEETDGMTGPGWRERVFDFYSLAGAVALRDALARFEGGHLVVNIVDMPIKCPVAPLEFAFLADDYFRRRGIRDRVRISYVTPLDGAFTKPRSAKALTHLLADKGIDNLIAKQREIGAALRPVA